MVAVGRFFNWHKYSFHMINPKMNKLKMNKLILTAVIAFAATFHAMAARAPYGKPEYVVEGKVEKIFERKKGRTTEYLIELRIGEVKEGANVKKGELLYVNCYQSRRRLLEVGWDSGHSDVPEEGDTITAYVHHREGKFEGNFPHWFDKADPPLDKK